MPKRIKDGRSAHAMYPSWQEVKRRACPDYKHARNYSERGIGVCEQWAKDFFVFLGDMGHRPKGLQIDRVNNDRGYCPHNCRWATVAQQIDNRRKYRKRNKDNEGLPTGVSVNRSRFRVKFTRNKKSITVGRYITLAEAIKAANAFKGSRRGEE